MPDPSFPQPGDTLFTKNASGSTTACLTYSDASKWEIYADGYKRAADTLVNDIVLSGQGMDFLVYPIAFLYRQYLELRFKQICLEGQELLDLPHNPPWGHRLDLLWVDSRKILEAIWPGSEAIALDAVEACVQEFHQLDERSDSFRYPMSTKGGATLADVKRIDLHHLGSTMERIAALLDGATTGIADYQQSKDESNASE